MIPAAIERDYPKRLLEAGWWHMSLFQQPATHVWVRVVTEPRGRYYYNMRVCKRMAMGSSQMSYMPPLD